jgi:type II secretory pathway pseudopilin PulG
MKSKSNWHQESRLEGFTRIELLAVLILIGISSATILPALARSRAKSLAFQCMNNNRQLCAAWRMYADESRDNIVFSSDDGRWSNPFNQWAWTASHLDFDPYNQSNWDTNFDIVTHPLWPYTARDASIYRCPADPSYVVFNGQVKPRVRSFAMNVYLGGFADNATVAPGNGPYRIYLKTTDLTAPSPSKIMIFVEERWETINWGNFYTVMAGYSPSDSSQYTLDQDLPGDIHNFAGSISFGDDHVELHRWRDPRTLPPLPQRAFITDTWSVPGDEDVAWLQDHATRPK